MIVGLYTQVKTEKLQNEHNEAALPGAADIRADVTGALRRAKGRHLPHHYVPLPPPRNLFGSGRGSNEASQPQNYAGSGRLHCGYAGFRRGMSGGTTAAPLPAMSGPDFPLTADM